MGIAAVIFDLDDTLYDESGYVRQAFGNTAAYLAGRLGEPWRREEFHRRMLEIAQQDGRGKIFDRLCEETGILIPVGELVEAYRDTRPVLSLYPDAEELLRFLRARGSKTGLITDGCSRVQHAKIVALGLTERLDSVIVTDDFGMCKPQPGVYGKCLEILGCTAQKAVYIGDNPRKDFAGARALGMKTVRIVREKGMYMDLKADPGQDADYHIRSLDEMAAYLKSWSL